MTDNLLVNSNFQDAYTFPSEGNEDVVIVRGGLIPYRTGNIRVPAGWKCFTYDNDRYTQIEMREAKTKERLFDGHPSLLYFKFSAPYKAGLMQTVHLQPGCYEFTAQAHGWNNHPIPGSEPGGPYASCRGNGLCSMGAWFDPFYALEGDLGDPTGDPWHDAPLNMVFRVGIGLTADPTSATIAWGRGAHIYNVFHKLPGQQIELYEPRDVTVFIETTTRWGYENADTYIGEATLEIVASPGPDPEPEPREYERTVHLIPQDTTLLELAEVVEVAAPRKETISWSADDSVINHPNLTKRTVHVWDVERIAGASGALAQWIDKYYPPLPKLVYHEFTTTKPPEPKPPTPTEPPTPAGYRNYMGPHLQTMVPGWDTYIENAHPTCAKAFSWNDVAGIKTRFPRLHVIGRHCTNNYGDTLENPNPAQGAKNWVDKFRGALHETCNRLAPLNLSKNEPWFYVESVNEVYPPTQRAATFDLAFIHELANTGLPIAPIVMTAAVGNPHESEFDLLLPLARACAAAKGAFGYHAYWYANARESGLMPYWQWLAGRWEEIDKVLVANGVRVKWFFGETGAVGGEFVPASAPGGLYSAWAVDLGPKCIEQGGIVKPVSVYIPKTQRCMPLVTPGMFAAATAQQDGGFILLPCDGWKSSKCYGGDFGRYLDDQRTFNVRTSETLAGRENRVLGGGPFTSGIGCGWDSFQLQAAEWRRMEALK